VDQNKNENNLSKGIRTWRTISINGSCQDMLNAKANLGIQYE